MSNFNTQNFASVDERERKEVLLISSSSVLHQSLLGLVLHICGIFR